MWAISEVPTVGYALIVAIQWMRSEERRARQWDRKADRDGEAELAAYNAYLARLHGDDAGGEATTGDAPAGEATTGDAPAGDAPAGESEGDPPARS